MSANLNTNNNTNIIATSSPHQSSSSQNLQSYQQQQTSHLQHLQQQGQHQQQQQQTSLPPKNMLTSLPPQPQNKDLHQFQNASNLMNFSVNPRKGVSTNERVNFSSSPVKITTKVTEISPMLAPSTQTNAKLNLFQTVNDPSYFKKIIQAPLHGENNLYPTSSIRPINLTQKYIRNFSSFLIEVQKNKQDHQFFCSHCRDLLWEPVKCQECTSHYCLMCATKNYTKQNKKCNSCSKVLITVPAEESVKKQLFNISLMCPNNMLGCSAALTFNSFELHQQDCRYKKGRGSENLSKPIQVAETKKRESVPIMPVTTPAPANKEKKDLVSCIHCYKNIIRTALDQHQNSCPLKLSICQYCQTEVPYTHMQVHVQYRCTKTIQCSQCIVNVPYDQYNSHIGNCKQYPTSKCTFCDQNFYKSHISEHLTSCQKNPALKPKKTVFNPSSNNLSSNKKQSDTTLLNVSISMNQNQQSSNGKHQNTTLNSINAINQNDITSLLSKGMNQLPMSPNKTIPSTEKLKFMVMDNMYKVKGRPAEYSFDHDLDQDKTTARTKMNTDASMSTEFSQNNINMQDPRINALLNTSIQMNTTLPLSPHPPQSKFRSEQLQTNILSNTGIKNISSQQNMLTSLKMQAQQTPSHTLFKQQIENPEAYNGNSYKITNLTTGSANIHANTFLSPQMTSSTRLSNQNYKAGLTQMNPATNTILQQFLNKNSDTVSGRSNSLQIMQTTTTSKTNSTQNLESKS